MANVKVFLAIETNEQKVFLRRFVWSEKEKCPLVPGDYSYHNAMSEEIEVRPVEWDKFTYEDGSERPYVKSVPKSDFKDHPKWPSHCKCGYQFKPEDEWQVWSDRIYHRYDDPEQKWGQRDLPVGAVWNAWWYWQKGPDGRSLQCKTPGGEWIIDGRANNCTMPEDATHRCWVRSGRPEDGTLHVDKNGHTCAAGAGSILCGSYHGFLIHGNLTDC